MQNGKLPNSALSASSQYNAYAGPENARLHFCAESGRYGAWIAQRNDHSQYYQVDFGVETQVTRIETQGRQDNLQYIKTYTLRYSTDGSYFRQYQPSGFTKVRCFLKLSAELFCFLFFRQSGIYWSFLLRWRFISEFPLGEYAELLVLALYFYCFLVLLKLRCILIC